MIIIIIIVFISIRARCNWPQLLRCPCQRSFCLFVCFFFGEANSNNDKNTNMDLLGKACVKVARLDFSGLEHLLHCH